MKKGFTSPLLFWPVLACALLSPLHASPPDLRDLLRDGLYKEEVNRDPEGAAKTYQDLLARNDEQRAFAATAQFRLAEVRRKQGRKDEAIEAYRQLLIRYPEAETECRIARENLAAMGSAAPATEGAPQTPSLATPEDGDEAFLATLKDIQTKAPDTLGNKENFDKAITQGYTKSVGFLLKNAPPSSQTPVLTMAVEAGSLEMVKLIYASGVKPNADESRMLLALAAAKNQFFIAQELLKQGIDVNGVPTNGNTYLPPRSIDEAAKYHQSIARYLPGTALTTAVAFGNPKLIDLILQSNPDVNARLSDLSYTALSIAVMKKDLPLVKTLLTHHADPNLTIAKPVSDEFIGLAQGRGLYGSNSWSPLDIALLTDNNNEIIRLLVQNGGKPTISELLLGREQGEENPDNKPAYKTRPVFRQLVEEGLKPSDLPDISMVVKAASDEELRLLLDRGLAPSSIPSFFPLDPLSPEKLKLLLDHGLSPDWSGNGVSLLSAACTDGRQDLVSILLEHNAKIPPADQNGTPILNAAATANFSDEILNALIDHGATMSPEWFETEASASRATYSPYNPPNGATQWANRSSVAPGARVRTLLFRRLLLPQLKSTPDIRLAVQTPFKTNLNILEAKSPSGHPESLEQIFERKRSIDWYSRADGSGGPTELTIWHLNSDGKRTSQTVALPGDSAFPALEWGDIVELSYAPEDGDIFGKEANSQTKTDSLPDDLIWKLRQRISFPVTVEMDGQTQELTMTGALVTFDPTQSSVPLMGAAQLARLISQAKPDRYFADTVTVIRQGWPEIRLLTESQPFADFSLQKGDRILWKTQDKPAGPMYLKTGPEIKVYSPGLPFVVRFDDVSTGGSPGPGGLPADAPAPRSTPRPTQPSLLQAIAALYSPENGTLKKAPGDAGPLAAWIPKGLNGQIVSVLPHPDLANIRIHRQRPDGAEGSEEIINVDLQKAADEMTPESTSEQARRADILLKPGDSVELPVAKDQSKPWTGFIPGQRRLMELALSGSIQVLKDGSALNMLTLSYRSPQIIQTPGGLVPLPASEGTSSLLASDVLTPGSYDAVNKEGRLYGMETGRMFLSERFQFIQTQAQPAPGIPPQSRPASRR